MVLTYMLVMQPVMAMSLGDQVSVPKGAATYVKIKGKTKTKPATEPFEGTVKKIKKTIVLVEGPKGGVWVKKADVVALPAAQAEEIPPLIPVAAPAPATAQSQAPPEKKPAAAAPAPTPVATHKPAAKAPAEGKKMHVLVLPLNGVGVDDALLKLINDHILLTLDNFPNVKVTSKAEMMVVTKYESEKQMLACESDVSCMAEVSKSLDAEAVLSGSIGLVGEAYVINLQLIDANKSVVLERASETAYHKEKINLAVTTALNTLFNPDGKKIAKRKFSLELKKGNNKFAMLDLAAAGVDEDLARNLTDIVTVELKRFKGLTVISRQEIQTMLQFEQQKQTMGCEDDISCFAEIGAALGVHYLVIGSVGNLEGVYVINLKLLNIMSAKVVNRVTETYKGPQKNLVMAARAAVEQLMGAEKDGKGTIRVRVSEDDAAVFLNGEKVGVYPAVDTVEAQAGKNSLRIEQDDAYSWYEETYVEPGDITEVDAMLSLKPTPWYKTWWFWTITSVVVLGAAGATTAVLLTRDDGKPTGTMEVPNPLLEQ